MNPQKKEIIVLFVGKAGELKERILKKEAKIKYTKKEDEKLRL